MSWSRRVEMSWRLGDTSRRIRRVVCGSGLLTGLLVSLGCVANKPMRPWVGDQPCFPHAYIGDVSDRTELDNNAWIVGSNYELAIVELDDQGVPWCPRQMEAVKKWIVGDRKEDGEKRDTCEEIETCGVENGNHPALVTVFVHGWKHNAAEKSKTLANFRRTLEHLEVAAPSDSGGASSVNYKKLGVYIAWRGKSIRPVVFSEFSFFGRKKAAEHVALGAARAIQNIVDWTHRYGESKRSTSVVIGHSFGGLIVENALLSWLNPASDNLALDFPSLAVLVNPANEAIHADQFVRTFQDTKNFTSIQGDSGTEFEPPLIVSLTSKWDRATRMYFPLGMSVSAFSESFRPRAFTPPGRRHQQYYFTRTPGHTRSTTGEEDRGIISHSVEVEDPLATVEKVEIPVVQVELSEPIETGEGKVQPRWIKRFCFDLGETNLSFERLSERGSGEPANTSPYWIMRVGKGLIPKHGVESMGPHMASTVSAFVNLRLGNFVEGTCT